MQILNGYDVLDYSLGDFELLDNPANKKLFVMDGTTLLRNDVTKTPLAKGGISTFASLLGRQAPVISAAAFTSMTYPTAGMLVAGQAETWVIACNTPWPGNDGVTHYLYETYGTDGTHNCIGAVKFNSNLLYTWFYDNAGTVRRAYVACDATNWPANTDIIIVCIRFANGDVYSYLRGVAFTTQNNGVGTGLESSVGATLKIGDNTAGTAPLNGSILLAIIKGVASAREIAAYPRMGAWFPRVRVGV